MKTLRGTKSKMAKDENGEKFSRLESAEVVLVYCNIANSDYQGSSEVLYTFVPNKSLSRLLDISPDIFIFLKTFNSEFSYVEAWFTHQNSKPPKVKYRIIIILVIY